MDDSVQIKGVYLNVMNFMALSPELVAVQRQEIADLVDGLDEVRLICLWNVALALSTNVETAQALVTRSHQARARGTYFVFIAQQLRELGATCDAFRLWIFWLAAMTISMHDVGGDIMYDEEGEDE